MTMKLIETKTLATAAASIEFTSIPQDGTDLVIVISARTLRSGEPDDAVSVKLNSSTSNFTNRVLLGNGSTRLAAASYFGQGYFLANATGSTATSNTFSNCIVYIPNYTAAVNKSITTDAVTENNGTTAIQVIITGAWADTSAITSILFDNFSVTNFVAGTTISLYKITKGSDGIVTTS
jgi:hypothetical protein